MWVQQAALDKEIDAVKEKHLLIARNLTGDLTRYIIDVESSFRLVAKNLATNHKLDGFEQHLDTLYIRYINIIKMDGTIVNSSSKSEKKSAALNPKVLNAIKPLLKKSITQIQTVFYSNMLRDQNNETTFYLIKAINQTLIAVGSLSTQHLREVQQKVVFGQRGHAAIVDKTGRAIAHPIKDWVATMKDMSFLPPVNSMMQGKTGVSQFYTPAMKADMVAGYTVVPIVGWGVMIPQPFSELEERAADVRIVTLLITIMGITIAGIFGWIVAGILSRPIQSVVTSANLKSDSSQLSKATTYHRFIPFEIKELLGSFNKMVDIIKDKTASIEATSNRLTEAQRIAHIGNWEFDIKRDKIWCSKEFYQICGTAEQQFDGCYNSLLEFIHPDDRVYFEATLKEVKFIGGNYRLNHRIMTPKGSICYVYHEGEVRIDKKSESHKLIGIIHDISFRKQYEDELRHQANYDELTDLPNRTLLIERLKQETRTSSRNNQKMALLSIDLDNFKLVNDTYGHVIGDKVLQQASSRLQSCIRNSDTLARLGGDQFCVILCDIQNEEDCSIVSDKIISSIEKTFTIDGHESFIGVSIGITLYPNDSQDANTLMRNADIALYRVKENERNNFCFFKEEMNQEVTNRMSLSNDLRKALEREEFSLVFQPIIDLNTGNISSAEALLRWIHPQRGFVSPDEFIPLAEHTGLIGPLGEWVLKTACETAVQWSSLVKKPPRISVNLSVRQLKLGLTKALVENILTLSQLNPCNLIFEITESLVMGDIDEAIAWMNSIRDLGVTFSVDDFGTGYSSLSYLKKLPVDILKIDRAFIKDLMENSEDKSLVKTIIAIGKTLNLKVVAEGVEDKEQLSFLHSIECDYIQGYYFSKPLPEKEFNELLSNWDFNISTLNNDP